MSVGEKRIDAYFIALVLLAVSIPLSKFIMSVTQFLLLVIWLTDGIHKIKFRSFYNSDTLFIALGRSFLSAGQFLVNNFKNKWMLFFKNKVAVAIASLFLLHIIGLIHTEDFNYAFKDLRTKLPILFLPLIMSSMPQLSAKKSNILLVFFILAVFSGSMFSLDAYLKKDFTDIRDISVFISSVRFSLTIVLSVFLLLFFLFRNNRPEWWLKAIIVTAIIWFVAFLMILESAIGLISLVIILSGIALVKAFRIKHMALRLLLLFLFFALPAFLVWYVSDIIKDISTSEPVNISELETHSALGNFYRHDTIHFGIEDGKYVGLYMAEEELAEAWNSVSDYDFTGYDEAGQLIQYTIIRYFTSIGLRKDASGVAQLTEKDIRNIEKGIANINYLKKPSIRTRVSKIMMGYRQFADLNDPNGSSVMQRIEYTKASVILIRENFWTGVGTGDLPQKFTETYEKMESTLLMKWRWRSHNQYLSIFIAFGVFGFFWFVFTLLYPVIAFRKNRNYHYLVFLALMLLSMITEDTIESQVGVTLFAFFNAFFLLAYQGNNESEA
jgi:hypothetical protein